MTEQDVLKDPTGLGNQITTRKFIKSEIDNLVSTIEMIEQKSGKILIGERAYLDRPYEDCKNMTNLQVVYFFSHWRMGIFARYNGIV